MDQTCKGCGMPMKTDEDHGGKNPQNQYCKFCCNPDGAVKPREERVKGMAGFMAKQKGIPMDQAMKEAEQKVAKE